jgi:hypothetical protein
MTSAILWRRWATPQYLASNNLHARDHPLPEIAPDFAHFPFFPEGRGIETSGSTMRANLSNTHLKSSPLLELKAPLTFSQIANFGYSPLVASLISVITRIISRNNPERSPAKPSRLPA